MHNTPPREDFPKNHREDGKRKKEPAKAVEIHLTTRPHEIIKSHGRGQPKRNEHRATPNTNPATVHNRRLPNTSHAEDVFRNNRVFRDIVRKWNAWTTPEIGRAMQDIIETTHKTKSDLARALGFDESDIRYYLRKWRTSKTITSGSRLVPPPTPEQLRSGDMTQAHMEPANISPQDIALTTKRMKPPQSHLDIVVPLNQETDMAVADVENSERVGKESPSNAPADNICSRQASSSAALIRSRALSQLELNKVNSAVNDLKYTIVQLGVVGTAAALFALLRQTLELREQGAIDTQFEEDRIHIALAAITGAENYYLAKFCEHLKETTIWRYHGNSPQMMKLAAEESIRLKEQRLEVLMAAGRKRPAARTGKTMLDILVAELVGALL